MRDALRHPGTDKAAKVSVYTWGLLLVIVGLNTALGLLMGSAGWFMLATCAVGLVVYPVCLKYALDGWKYRMKLRAVASDRMAFEQIVNGL